MKLEFSKFQDFYKDHQKKDNAFFYDHFSKEDKAKIRSYKSRAKKILVSNKVSPIVSKKTITLDQGKPSTTEDLARIIESIENPVAFASAHIFKKMIETGDVRWAQLYVSVLDKTKKLDYETIKEEQWLKQANNMSMDDLVSRVAMKGSTSKNILRRLEEAEDTSVYDNF